MGWGRDRTLYFKMDLLSFLAFTSKSNYIQYLVSIRKVLNVTRVSSFSTDAF
jgi:hypothetical protein